MLVVAIGALVSEVVGRFVPAYSSDWIHAALTIVIGILGGWALARVLDFLVVRRFLSTHRRWILAGESLVVISTKPDDAAAAASTLSDAAGEHPAVFVLHPIEPPMERPVSRPHPALGSDEIHLRAMTLAGELRNVKAGTRHRGSLIPRLNYCERVLARVQARLDGAVRLEQGIALSAEWLLDNSYVLRGHMEDFRRNLPPSYYQELPYLTSGPWEGLPRVYAIACELVADWDGALTRREIESFLQTFQSETTLTTAELWALPMMLRLRLIEYIANLGAEIERRQSESEYAAFWANRLLYTARREADRMPEALASVAAECQRPSPHIVESLLDHLYDEDSAITPIRSWLQAKFPAPLEDIVRQDAQLEAADQASLANSISTLKLLSQFDWRDLFEAVSHVEATLWTDPALIYSEMDFETRDRYRHEIEKLGKRGGIAEERVAEAAIALARAASEEPKNHVGFYLIDEGVLALEKHLQVRPTLGQGVRRTITRHPAFVYLTCVGLATALFVGIALYLSLVAAEPIWTSVALALLFLLPASALGVHTVNDLVTRFLKPHALPKMAFDDGIPDQARTLVVVPMMLLTPSSIQDEVDRLEIRALANPDKNLRFALLSDFCDAPKDHMPEDLELLDFARRGIDALNERHESIQFLLFYRDRTWSDCEQCWMGWERKRGKLEELNNFLMNELGADRALKVGTGSLDAIAGIRFILTLDSDTQLPRETAKRLVATLAHPLNVPHLSPDGRKVLRGYTIIQPRVSTSLPSATASTFTRIFTDPTGMDPYTHAVSDVYQDLAGSGSYHGKGIYDLAAFHRVLSGRFPESASTEPRSHRRRLRSGWAGERYRTARSIPRKLRGVLREATSLDQGRLADCGLAPPDRSSRKGRKRTEPIARA